MEWGERGGNKGNRREAREIGKSVSFIYFFPIFGRSAASSTASLKWKPMSEHQRRSDDGPSVGAISVLKRDKPIDNHQMSDNVPSTSINDVTDDSHANAVDFADIENSFSDVSRSLCCFAVTWLIKEVTID